MAIDIIDEKILEVLQENARISISELSKRVNLSLSAVSDRLKKLEQNGVVKQYTAILDPEEMNKSISAILLVSVDNTQSVSDFLHFVEHEADILRCSRLTGDYDYIIEIYSLNQQGLQSVIDRIKSFKCVRRAHSDVLLDKIKEKYSVPPVATRQ